MTGPDQSFGKNSLCGFGVWDKGNHQDRLDGFSAVTNHSEIEIPKI